MLFTDSMGCFSSKEQIKAKHPAPSTVAVSNALSPTTVQSSPPASKPDPPADTYRSEPKTMEHKTETLHSAAENTAQVTSQQHEEGLISDNTYTDTYTFIASHSQRHFPTATTLRQDDQL